MMPRYQYSIESLARCGPYSSMTGLQARGGWDDAMSRVKYEYENTMPSSPLPLFTSTSNYSRASDVQA